jgi:hypothetical protein
LEALSVSKRRVLKYVFKNKMGGNVECIVVALNKAMRFQVLHKAGNFLTKWGLAITSRMTFVVGFIHVITEDFRNVGTLNLEADRLVPNS